MLFKCNKEGRAVRKIEFRVWDLDNKEWYHSPQLVIRPYSGSVTDGATTPNVVLSQCTRIKDKNGKEIYEGDIIEYKTVYEWDKKPIKRAEVVFENGMFSPAGVIMDLSRSEIIGNIYENPELLEVN